MPSWVAVLISGSVQVVIAVIVAAVAWGVVKTRLDELSRLRQSLFKSDGTLVYVPATILCKKLDETNKSIKEFSDRLHKIELHLARLLTEEEIIPEVINK